MEGTTFAADPMRLMIATAGKSAAKESVERFRKYIGVQKGRKDMGVEQGQIGKTEGMAEVNKNQEDDRSQQVCKTEVTYYDAESNHKRLG